MQVQMKKSRQREAILDNLSKRYDHPTADMVYSSLKETMPHLSLGTVYRNLSQLAEHGIIQKLSFDGKVDHFDYNDQPHPHFFCQCCGKVTDFTLNRDFDANQYLPKEFKGRIIRCLLTYQGICEDCQSDA